MFEVFSTPSTDRFLEDYKAGATYQCGSFSISEDEIIAFAKQYDPQSMHSIPTPRPKDPSARSSPVAGTLWHALCGSWSKTSCRMTT
jgi:hypothetical protein